MHAREIQICIQILLRSAVRLPPTSYPLWDALPSELIDSGKLSSLQLEGILNACRYERL